MRRYDSVDLDAAITGNDDRDLWSLGINLGLYQHFRAKLEYRMFDRDDSLTDNDTLLGKLIIDF